MSSSEATSPGFASVYGNFQGLGSTWEGNEDSQGPTG